MINSYEALEQVALPMLPLYIILAVFSLLITILMFRKWFERRKTPALLLFLTFLGYTMGIIILAIGFTEAVITGEKREIYKFSLAAGYFMTMIANSFLILFASDIFGVEKKYIYKYIILSVILAIFVALPQNYYGVPEAEVGSDSIRIYSSAAMMFSSILIYTQIYRKSIGISKSSTDITAKIGFKYIGYSQICLILFFSFQLIDAAIFTIFETPGYSIFIYLGWVSAGCFMFLSYAGLIMPKWLKQRNSIE